MKKIRKQKKKKKRDLSRPDQTRPSRPPPRAAPSGGPKEPATLFLFFLLSLFDFLEPISIQIGIS
jgi:hypothetical protein